MPCPVRFGDNEDDSPRTGAPKAASGHTLRNVRYIVLFPFDELKTYIESSLHILGRRLKPPMLLPLSLLALVQSFLTLVDAQNTRLSLDTVQSLNTTALPNPPVFTIPSSNGPLYVSVALCANSSNPPRLFVTNDTGITQPNLGDVDNVNTYELTIGPLGYGSVMAMFPNNGFISVMKGSTETNFELLVSATSTSSCRLGWSRTSSHVCTQRCDGGRRLSVRWRHDIQPGTRLLPSLRPRAIRAALVPKLHPPVRKPVTPCGTVEPRELLPRLRRGSDLRPQKSAEDDVRDTGRGTTGHEERHHAPPPEPEPGLVVARLAGLAVAVVRWRIDSEDELHRVHAARGQTGCVPPTQLRDKVRYVAVLA